MRAQCRRCRGEGERVRLTPAGLLLQAVLAAWLAVAHFGLEENYLKKMVKESGISPNVERVRPCVGSCHTEKETEKAKERSCLGTKLKSQLNLLLDDFANTFSTGENQARIALLSLSPLLLLPLVSTLT